MRYELGVEEIEPGHWLAWVFALPGCFSSAGTHEEAVARAPARVAAHCAWLAGHGAAPAADGAIETAVVEVFRPFIVEGDYLVNAFFAADRPPLTRDETRHGLWLLDCTRGDLLALLARVPAGRRAAVEEILAHIANVEWWYLDRLGLAGAREALPDETPARLAATRARTRERLPALAGDGRVVSRVGEAWSARKVLRRLLWHERDHTAQIAALLGAPAS